MEVEPILLSGDDLLTRERHMDMNSLWEELLCAELGIPSDDSIRSVYFDSRMKRLLNAVYQIFRAVYGTSEQIAPEVLLEILLDEPHVLSREVEKHLHNRWENRFALDEVTITIKNPGWANWRI